MKESVVGEAAGNHSVRVIIIVLVAVVLLFVIVVVMISQRQLSIFRFFDAVDICKPLVPLSHQLTWRSVEDCSRSLPAALLTPVASMFLGRGASEFLTTCCS